MVTTWLRGLLVLVLVARLAADSAPSSLKDSSDPTLRALLVAYDGGEFDRAVREGASRKDLAAWPKTFPATARLWIAEQPAVAARRRMAAAGLALEITAARQDRDFKAWEPLRDVIEWACEVLRAGGRAGAGERAWFRGSLAVGGRSRDYAWLTGLPRRRGPMLSEAGPVLPMFEEQGWFFWEPTNHLSHVEGGLGLEAEVRVTNAIARAEIADTDLINCCHMGRVTSVDGRVDGGFHPSDDVTAAAVTLFEPLLTDPEWGGFAAVHVAHLYWVAGRWREALTQARAAVRPSSPPAVVYQAHVLAGLSLERLGARADAIEAYRRAASVVPSGQSAILALAALGDEAATDRVATVLGAMSSQDDPFRLYYYGTYMFWSEYVTALHEALR